MLFVAEADGESRTNRCERPNPVCGRRRRSRANWSSHRTTFCLWQRPVRKVGKSDVDGIIPYSGSGPALAQIGQTIGPTAMLAGESTQRDEGLRGPAGSTQAPRVRLGAGVR